MLKRIIYRYSGVIPNFITLKRKKVNVGKNTHIIGEIAIYGDKGSISIGDNCIIMSTDIYNPAGGFYRTYISAIGGKIFIGNNVGISLSSIYSCKGITIGDYTQIGAGVSIYDTDFHPLDWRKRMNKDTANSAISKEINIGKHVFIGSKAIILKGVTIGDRSIIGAGSVVTKSVPENEIWAGNPARFIRKID